MHYILTLKVSAFSSLDHYQLQVAYICSRSSSREMKITFLALLVSTVTAANAGLITSDAGNVVQDIAIGTLGTCVRYSP